MSKARARWLTALVGLLLLVLMTPGAHGAEGKPYVVLVGVGEFADPAIQPRPRAEADVKALYDLLADKKAFAGSTDQIKLLLGKADPARKSEPATRENILKAVKWALNSASADDTVLLCLVTQGAPIGDRTCYFASDSTLKDRAKDAVGAADLEQEIDKTKSTRVCVLLDVDFKGYKENGEKVSEAGLARRFAEFSGQLDESDAPPKPIMFLSATNGLMASPDLEQHGLFMATVLDALKGKADTEGNEPDGLVTVDELFEYVRKEMPQKAKTELARDQLPVLAGQSTHFPIAINPPAAAKVKEQLAKLEGLAKDGKLTEEMVKEGRDYLSRMPRLDAQKSLRKKFQELVAGTLAVDDFVKQRQEVLEGLKLRRADADSFAERVLQVGRLVKDSYVKPVTMGELVSASVKGLYRRVEEKIPDELNERLNKIKELSDSGLQTLLADARQQLGNRDDLKGAKATELALDSMLHSLDHYSSFIDQATVKRFQRETQQTFIGVGIQIVPDYRRGMIRVNTPIRGSPAHGQGVSAGDIIVKVTNTVDKEGKPLPQPEVTLVKDVIAQKGMDAGMNYVVEKILGPRNTKVTLTIEREGVEKPIDFEIKRGSVEVETVLGVRRRSDDSWDYYLDPQNRIAYVRLTQFAMHTERDLKKVLAQLEKQEGIGGLVLDLRFNPGGYLDSAVEISDLFIDDGLIVKIKPREGAGRRETPFPGQPARDEFERNMLKFPMVVLVNGGSASASEIVSACLQDHGRAVVMGERSFGKGSVQNIMRLPAAAGSESQVKLTTASFWRPNGKNLARFPNSKPEDDWGVRPQPDYELKLTQSEQRALVEHLRNQEIIHRKDAPRKESDYKDTQLEKAIEYLRKTVTAQAPTKKAG